MGIFNWFSKSSRAARDFNRGYNNAAGALLAAPYLRDKLRQEAENCQWDFDDYDRGYNAALQRHESLYP